MSVETTSYERQGFYSLKQFDDVATLKLGKNFLSNAIDLALKIPWLMSLTILQKKKRLRSWLS
ncbi:MAG: hypothetical protein ACQ9MH_20110 [Nitrospinales bacterium]